VLIGGGRTFVAGADIKEFGKMTSVTGKSRGAGLLPLLLKIEDSSKQVIVAIHGTALATDSWRATIVSLLRGSASRK
jgi:3-hydroxyacyl-CoA dehydrogenase